MGEKMHCNISWLPVLLTVIAGLSTGLGGMIPLLIKNFSKEYLQFFLGLSAGVMMYVSFVELLGAAIRQTGILYANLAFFAGILVIMAIDVLIPHEYIEEHAKTGVKDKKLLSAATLTAIGIAIHNFPEGFAVFISCTGDIKLGMSVALAIIIHNIPEGIAISAPVYKATGSRGRALLYSLATGVAEPLGALVGMLILAPFCSPTFISLSFAFVAGIMVFISFDELLPLSYENQKNHIAVFGIIIGMLIMFISTLLIR